MRLSEMVGRRLREGGLHARTLQLKLRYKDFTTITRAHTLPSPTQLDNEIFEQIRLLFRKNWRKGAQVRLLGVQASSFEAQAGQGDLLEDGRRQRWQQALIGRRSPARQVWRIQRVAGQRTARRIPRAYPRESGGTAGEGKAARVMRS